MLWGPGCVLFANVDPQRLGPEFHYLGPWTLLRTNVYAGEHLVFDTLIEDGDPKQTRETMLIAMSNAGRSPDVGMSQRSKPEGAKDQEKIITRTFLVP